MASLQGRGPGAAFALSALGLSLVAAAVAIVWVARSLCQFGGPRLAGPADAAAATAAATGGHEPLRALRRGKAAALASAPLGAACRAPSSCGASCCRFRVAVDGWIIRPKKRSIASFE